MPAQSRQPRQLRLRAAGRHVVDQVAGAVRALDFEAQEGLLVAEALELAVIGALPFRAAAFSAFSSSVPGIVPLTRGTMQNRSMALKAITVDLEPRSGAPLDGWRGPPRRRRPTGPRTESPGGG